MKLTQEIKEKRYLNAEQLVQLFDYIAQNGHVLIVKADGDRDVSKFTCVISFPDDPEKAIRMDGETLLEAVFLAVSNYDF